MTLIERAKTKAKAAADERREAMLQRQAQAEWLVQQTERVLKDAGFKGVQVEEKVGGVGNLWHISGVIEKERPAPHDEVIVAVRSQCHVGVCVLPPTRYHPCGEWKPVHHHVLGFEKNLKECLAGILAAYFEKVYGDE